eukprot:7285273-Pyramimonas_sp.AAC.1
MRTRVTSLTVCFLLERAHGASLQHRRSVRAWRVALGVKTRFGEGALQAIPGPQRAACVSEQSNKRAER